MIENPLVEHLKNHTLVLGSGSPRRKKFLEDLGLRFKVEPKSVEEVYPSHLKGSEISDFLAELKAEPFKSGLASNEIVITSDTVVWHKGESLAKAGNQDEALLMLRTMSGDWHEVITSVCFTSLEKQLTVNTTTHVKFIEFSEEELNYYVDHYRPFDKAGAYGIQEWLGMIGISEIKGSYTNVVGLPTHLVYKTLMAMVS